MRNIIVGTRQSTLARTQTGQVIVALQEICKQHELPFRFEIRQMMTKGDRILGMSLSKFGGKGLFVKEIEQALLDKQVDIAVHSMKDMPIDLPEGLIIGAIPQREDARDCLVLQRGRTLDDLPWEAKVGTSSLRRSCQLQAYRPDLRIESLRGNIDTRLKKLEMVRLDAVVLAAAGLHRMGWHSRISSYLSADISVPAVGQGALAIECRQTDEAVSRLLKRYHDADTARTVRAERAVLGLLNGGCQVPIGAYATYAGRGSIVRLTGLVGCVNSGQIIKETQEGEHPEALGTAVAEQLLARGADRMLFGGKG